jgi:sucrose phosphorylase
MLAGRNDIQLLENSKEGRNINRHYYTLDEIEEEVKRPVVQQLIALMELRSTHSAFNGEFSQQILDKQHLILSWKTESESIELRADFQTYEFEIVEHS